MQRQDEGTIKINGQEVNLHSPSDAIKAGIGMVFQHFMLADNLTVLENVVPGAENLHGIGGNARREITRIAQEYGPMSTPTIWSPTRGRGPAAGGDPQGPYRGAKILILDEPTAVLVPRRSTSCSTTCVN